jgi:acylphosphatase
MMKTAYEIIVKGRVQGVGFRYNTIRAAAEHGIKGYVKNEMDGSVFILAEGDEQDIKAFIAWCNEGPAYARVEEVMVDKIEYAGYTEFTVKR